MWTHQALFKQLLRRSIAERYRGSMFGALWNVLVPLLMLGIYSFVFIYVFNARFGEQEMPKGHFALMLFSGLALHQFFSESLIRSTTIIRDQSQYVKKVIFPLHILVPMVVGTAGFQLMINFALLLIATLSFGFDLSLHVLWLPLILLPFVLLTLGACWLLCALAMYVRDIAHLMGVLTTLLLFVSTIFYSSDRLPEYLQWVIYLNPLSFMVDNVRLVVFGHKLPNFVGLGVYGAISVAVCGAGLWFFQRVKSGFSDVL